jgi:hypothetical protein
LVWVWSLILAKVLRRFPWLALSSRLHVLPSGPPPQQAVRCSRGLAYCTSAAVIQAVRPALNPPGDGGDVAVDELWLNRLLPAVNRKRWDLLSHERPTLSYFRQELNRLQTYCDHKQVRLLDRSRVGRVFGVGWAAYVLALAAVPVALAATAVAFSSLAG